MNFQKLRKIAFASYFTAAAIYLHPHVYTLVYACTLADYDTSTGSRRPCRRGRNSDRVTDLPRENHIAHLRDPQHLTHFSSIEFREMSRSYSKALFNEANRYEEHN